LFYLFHLCTRWHYYLLTLDVGGAKYQATGRGFIIEHQPFLKLFQQFGRSHFLLGFDLLCLLLVMGLFDRSGEYGAITVWCWVFGATCLWAPFLYNFEGLHYEKVRNDFWQFWGFMQGGWLGRSVAWEAWHVEKTKLYDGVNVVLALRGSIYLLIPGAIFFKYFEFFMLEYHYIPINLVVILLLALITIVHCIFQGISAIAGDSSHTWNLCWTYLWVIATIGVAVLIVVTALILRLYSMPAEFLWMYLIVLAYTMAFVTNTCFYLGARWEWITRLYWLVDLIIGLIIFIPLFSIAIFRVCDSVHMRLLYNSQVLEVLERAKLKTRQEDDPVHFQHRRKSTPSSKVNSSLNSPLIGESMDESDSASSISSLPGRRRVQ